MMRKRTQNRRARSDRRPIPDDFAEIAPGMTKRALARRYRTSAAVVRRWAEEAEIVAGRQAPSAFRPVPADFATLGPTTTAHHLRKHYSVGVKVLARWIDETGVKPIRGIRYDARPVPDDFTALAPTMFASRLCAHYDCAPDVIARWSRLTGVTPPKGPRGRPRPKKEATPKVARLATHRSFAGPKSTFIARLHRDSSIEGQAADHLRKFCAVYRCTDRGAADQHGSHWRYGNAVLTGEEMVARAERNGFDPAAWRRIAA